MDRSEAPFGPPPAEAPRLEGPPVAPIGGDEPIRVVPAEDRGSDSMRRADELERRADATAAEPGSPRRTAEALAGVERDLLRLRLDLSHADPDVGVGNPFLFRLSGWRDAAVEAGATNGAEAARALLETLLRDETKAWRRSAQPALAARDADRCFEALGRATLLEREAISLLGADGTEAARATEDRASLRDAFRDALVASPPPAGTKDRWTRDLLDRADVVLTGLDDVPPALAALHLDLVEEDLARHLAEVETSRGPRRRRLRRKLRRLRAERQERDLQARIETQFGWRAAARFERWVISLILLVLGLLLVEALFDLPEPVRIAFTIADTLACAVFLTDFFVRLALVRGKRLWFRRHVLLDLLPSLPFGLLVLGFGHADPARAGRLARLLRLPQAARYVRVLLPVIRLVRALGFLARGLDRLARRYGHLLNRDVILHPTRAERDAFRNVPIDPRRRIRHAEAAVDARWDEVLAAVPAEAREDVILARVRGLERARAEGLLEIPPRGGLLRPARAVPADVLLDRLETAHAREVEQDLDADLVARVARGVRWMARPPLRWLPPIRGAAPRLAPRLSDAEVVAAGARSLGARLRRARDRWLWFADLYGTVTPAEFVDRVGTAMVRGSVRPAYRLTVFGLVFLLVQGLLALAHSSFLQWLHDALKQFVGTTLVVLGGICLVILGIGWWLKRLANEATAFYEQVAGARFLPLMESVKGRHLATDAATFERRVFGPEARVRGEDPASGSQARRRRFVDDVRSWLLEAHVGSAGSGDVDPVQRAAMLYRDALNGGLCTENDVRTTNQLLGNPALADLWRRCRRVDRAERRGMRKIDLARQRAFVRGPYLWFSFVTTALEHSVARLIVDYDRHALPLADLDAATPAERDRYESWRERRPGIAPATDPRADRALSHVTTDFTALHFLDDDPRRDREVGLRFGDAVLRRLREDRRLLFRRVFGTFPFQDRPREQRVLNLYELYDGWLAGGRVFLVPLRLVGRSLGVLSRWAGWARRAVREIRRPALRAEIMAAAGADFATAVRKIDRMRGPVVRACLWMRARLDPEYLGLPLPGETHGTRAEGHGPPEVDRDLRFLVAAPDLLRRIDDERRRARADVHRFAELIGGGLATRLATHGTHAGPLVGERLRAAVVAYRGDLDGVRTLLSCEDILKETVDGAAHGALLPRRFVPAPRLARAFSRWWRARGGGDPILRRATWRRVRNDVDGAERALRAWSALGLDAARAAGERALAEILRHPQRLSEQLVTLRAVHTLALVDVRNDRDHVWRLGRYADDGEQAGPLLALEEAP